MRTVVIAGVGLIGGSFARALRAAGFDGRIVGVSSPRTLQAALSLGVVDEGAALEAAVPQADLVFLSQPVSVILQTLRRLPGLVKAGALVTDAGSTKARILEAANGLGEALFVGGHPMAGKETRGVEEADADLFRGRTWIFTPRRPEDLEAPATVEFRQWVVRIGAIPFVLDAATHDRLVALTSHLPQIVSTALASALASQIRLPGDAPAAGPALLDMTRLALSDYSMWGDIIATNADNIGAALDAFMARLSAIREKLHGGDLSADFERAAKFASALRETRTQGQT